MFGVVVQVGVQTYASRYPSSLCVTMIRSRSVTGDHAIRTARIGLAAVDSSTSAVHAEPSHILVFGLLTVFVPVFDRYAASASSSALFAWLHAMCGFPLESVE